jgi:hypothetical protein
VTNLLAGSVEVGVEYLEYVGKSDDLSPGGLASNTKGDLTILPRDQAELKRSSSHQNFTEGPHSNLIVGFDFSFKAKKEAFKKKQ